MIEVEYVRIMTVEYYCSIAQFWKPIGTREPSILDPSSFFEGFCPICHNPLVRDDCTYNVDSPAFDTVCCITGPTFKAFCTHWRGKIETINDAKVTLLPKETNAS